MERLADNIKIGGGDDPFDKRGGDGEVVADEYGNTSRNAIDLVVSSKNGITYSNNQGYKLCCGPFYFILLTSCSFHFPVIGYDLVRMLHTGVFRVSSTTFFACFNIGQAFIVFGMVTSNNAFFVSLLIHVKPSVTSLSSAKSIIVMLCCVAMVEVEIFTLGDGSMLAVQASVDNIYTYFGGLTGLLFVYFVFNGLAGYNACKNSFGQLQGSMVELIILTTSSWVPGKSEKEMEFKEKILRWGIATFALTSWVAGGEIMPSEAVGRAVEQDFLTGEEAEVMKASNFHVCNPLLWMVPEYEKFVKNDMKMQHVEDLVLSMRSGVGGVMTLVSNYGQPPLPVTHLMSFLVKMVCMVYFTFI